MNTDSVLEECAATIDLGVPAWHTNNPLCHTDPLRHPTRILNRPLPQDCTRYDIFLRQLDLGLADRMVMGVKCVGEPGWEINHPLEQQDHIQDTLNGARSERLVAGKPGAQATSLSYRF